MGLTVADGLAVQAHCLRHAMAADFKGVITRLRSMGFRSIELCSFPGCAGNPWGDFGDLATWEPGRVRSVLADAGIGCLATHVTHDELLDENLDSTVKWAREAGAPVIVLAGLPCTADTDLSSWRAAFAFLNATGRRVRDSGLGFAYHTQNDVWSIVDGTVVADEMFRVVDPEACCIELDPSGTLVYGSEWMPLVRRNAGRFLALHLRDGVRPPERTPWLPALPLGEGETDWLATLEIAAASGIRHHILEMEVSPDRDVFDALETSVDYLEALQRH